MSGRCHAQDVLIHEEEANVVHLAEQADGALGYGIQDRLQVSRRRGDDPQHLGGRRLLLDERRLALTEGSILSVTLPKRPLQLRDPRVAIVRHPVHPGPIAPLRDGARIARSLKHFL
jgi:hypothetical protein